MDIELMLRVYPFFLEAAWVTILLSILTAILGLICGALGAAARLSRFALVRFLGAAYVSVFRGTPALFNCLFSTSVALKSAFSWTRSRQESLGWGSTPEPT
ncbi:ABC transporter permease subunit [Yoonia sp. 1_MG-2023]|nr:ABC transporter permease subunit [Yoonia sp. 1_MG-2023]MDO6589423.1 ABC transporter permease subunit [Yoonia sp. 1_MG-2023]